MSRKTKNPADKQTGAGPGARGELQAEEGAARGAPVARTATHRDATTGFVGRTDFDLLDSDASEKSTEIHRQRQAYSRDAAIIKRLTGISRCVSGGGGVGGP
jgi:hypothetical protein